MYRKIKLENVEDVKQLNKKASSVYYDTFVHSTTDIIDAKSILGLMAMIGKEDLLYIVPDDRNPRWAFKGIKNLIKV